MPDSADERQARMVELVDAVDSKSTAERRGGSSPSAGTKSGSSYSSEASALAGAWGLCSKGANVGQIRRVSRVTMLRKLYDNVLALAQRPSAPYALAAVSFAESSFFPIPPDVMLLPMVLARPDRAWFYALICTVASVLGGLLGYAIGALLFGSVGAWLFHIYGLDSGAEAFREGFAQYGHWFILIKGVTPIPYKIVTITSGFAGYNLIWFVVLSLITRGARFFLFAGLIGRFGEPIKAVLDRHLGVAAAILVVTIVGGFALVRFLH
jgi:membrane protein YqaA with SNARE-associated domain